MRHLQAYSLLELLIAMAIIAILSVVAYPNYKQYFSKTDRLSAESTLQKFATELEEYHLTHHTYRGAHIKTMNTKHYQLRIETLEKNKFIISANSAKERLTLNQNGELSTLLAAQIQ